MILETGLLHNRRTAGRHGFTLVEMVLVLALLVVAVSLVSPRISGFIRARAVESEARRLLAITHAGRSRAISEGRVMYLWLDAAQGRYGLEPEIPGRRGDSAAIEFSSDPGLQVSFTTATSLLGQTGSGILPKPLSAAGNRVRSPRNVPGIRLLPDGSIDEESPQAMQIRDGEGSTLWLVEGSDRRHYEIRTTDH